MPIRDYISLASAGVSAVGNYLAQSSANKTNIELANKANQWSLEQWQRENAYNSPSAQVQRLHQAGINPGLMYGDGGMMNEAASSPAVTPGTGVRPYLMDPLTMAQVGLINAQKDKAEAESTDILSQLPEKLKQYEQERKESDAKIEQLNQTVALMQQQILNLQEDKKLTVEKQITESFQRTMSLRSFDEMCRRNTAEINKWGAEMDLMKKQGKKVDAETEDIKAARDLKVQEYKYNAAANAYRLLLLQDEHGLNQIRNTLYRDQHQLNLDQHGMNLMQKTLLGFEISNGRLQAARSNAIFNDAYGDGDWIVKHITEPMVAAFEHLLSPIGNILKISIK